jgi:hypothetical protein
MVRLELHVAFIALDGGVGETYDVFSFGWAAP